MSSFRTERYDAISTRILCEGGWMVAMIEQLSNGRWIISVGDQRFTNRTFAGVRPAFKWWQERQSAIAAGSGTAETAKTGSVRSKPERPAKTGIAQKDTPQ